MLVRALRATDPNTVELVHVGIGHKHCPAECLRSEDVVEHGTFAEAGVDAEAAAPDPRSSTRCRATNEKQQGTLMVLKKTAGIYHRICLFGFAGERQGNQTTKHREL